LSFHALSPGQVGDLLAEETRWLDRVDHNPSAAGLCLWEQSTPAVVVGRSNVIEREVDVDACAADHVPIFQRSSGGGTVVLGPGCLCYALLLPISETHRRLGVTAVTADIMQHLAASLSRPGQPVSVQGVSDLVIEDRKFSGNAQRWRRTALLHHGTVLYDFDLERIGRYLRFPSRVPVYRHERSHRDFVCNLNLSRAEIVDRLRRTWNAS